MNMQPTMSSLTIHAPTTVTGVIFYLLIFQLPFKNLCESDLKKLLTISILLY